MALLALLAAGCGGAEREYTVRKSLCGVKVDPELVKPFLADGKKLYYSEEGWDQNMFTHCFLRVDKTYDLNVTGQWRAKGYTTRKAADEMAHHPVTFSANGTYAVWERGAATVIPCKFPKISVGRLDGKKIPDGTRIPAGALSVRVASKELPEDTEASEDAMGRFIVAYAKGLRKVLPCESG